MEYYKCIHGKFEGDYCGICGHIVPRGNYNKPLKTNKEPVAEVPCCAGLCKLVAEWYDQGWRIQRTSCNCGGNWAWLKKTDRGTMKMYGCVCHNVPNEKFA